MWNSVGPAEVGAAAIVQFLGVLVCVWERAWAWAVLAYGFALLLAAIHDRHPARHRHEEIT